MHPTEDDAEAGGTAEASAKGESGGADGHPAPPQAAAHVAPQITDALTQANVTSLGIGPAFAIVQSFLAASQAQGVLFANMVQEHQQLGTAGLAATVQSVIQILGTGGNGGNGGG